MTLLLRLWGIKQGLPYSYNVDEATHFVPRAIAFFSHDLNPKYFLNPPAYSYLLHIVFELWFGSGDAVSRAYTVDPTEVFVVARVVAAVLGTIAVWLTYLAGVRLFGPHGRRCSGPRSSRSHSCRSSTATWRSTTFRRWRPSRCRCTGSPACCGDGWRRDYVLSGVAIGLAAATKYTGGITVVCLLGAAVAATARRRGADAARGGWRWRCCAALAAFVLANPYSVLDFSAFQAGVATQQSLAGGGATRSSSAPPRPAAPPTTCGRSPGDSAGCRRWRRSAGRCCCWSAGG